MCSLYRRDARERLAADGCPQLGGRGRATKRAGGTYPNERKGGRAELLVVGRLAVPARGREMPPCSRGAGGSPALQRSTNTER